MSLLPWTLQLEEHLGSPAYSLFAADGDRIAVGLLRADAEAICAAVNITLSDLERQS